MAAESEHKFRYLLKPGNDFRLVKQFKAWVIFSIVLCTASVAMLFVNKSVRGDYLNWTIDFKGGSEFVFAFKDKNDPEKYVEVSVGDVREAIAAGGDDHAEVSGVTWEDEKGAEIKGMTVRTPKYGAMTDAQRQATTLAIEQAFAEKGIEKVSWSGDRVFVRSKQLIPAADMATTLAGVQLEMKPVEAGQAKINETINNDTQEYNATFTVYGLDKQYEQALESRLGDVDVVTVQSDGVGAKAGEKLRNDGIKALFYAMGLIMLYLAIRFDIRYAPGAVIAMVHDALMVVGVFAVTWTEVSLTSVAALLTVIGFSVNDTVIIFDRMRENLAKLKDKKIERVVEISLNEVLVRSILTSAIVFSTTLIMNVFGTGLVKNFAFAMNAGIIVGVYSSIFLAPPVFLWIHRTWYSGPPKARARKAATAES
jgi:preprotein translocase subunit SecF